MYSVKCSLRKCGGVYQGLLNVFIKEIVFLIGVVREIAQVLCENCALIELS